MPWVRPCAETLVAALSRLAAVDAARAQRLEDDDPLGPRRGRGARSSSGWMDGGYFHPPAEGTADGELLDRDPAAERHRRPAHGPRPQRDHAGHAGADAPDAGPQHALDPRHRPRRDRRRRRCVEKELQAEGTSRHELGHEAFMERVVGVEASSTARRSSSSTSAWAPRATTRRERFTLDEGYVKAVYRVFIALYEQGLHLPRQLHGQLGPGLALGDLGPRGGEPRGDRHAVLDRLPARGLATG